MHLYKKSLIAAAIVAAMPATTVAQQLEEVLVTATKREATVQDLPFSVNAQTNEDIERTNAFTLEDLARNVAGLSIQNLGPGQSQVAIRGVSAGQIIRDQPGVKEQVGVYMDETVISLSLFTPDFDLYDLNRVETLRGPQGTLFGSGSIGGTVRFISNQPQFDALDASVEANVQSIDGDDEGGHLKGMLNIPISDTLAMRVVGYATEYAGYIDALGENGAKDEDVNGGDRQGGRIALTWQPTDTLTITPRVIYQDLTVDGFNRGEEFNLFANPYTTTRPPIQLDSESEQYLLLDEEFEDETTLADIVVNWELDWFDVTFVGSYIDREILVSRDASALTGSVGVDPFGFPDEGVLLPSNLRDTTDLEQTTYELRFASNDDGRLQWVAGFFYSDVEREYAQRLPTPGHDFYTDQALGEGTAESLRNGFPADSPFNSDLDYDIEQTAVFGELTYEVTEKLDVTVGGRYYDFEETRDILQGGVFSSLADQTDDTESDGFTPRIMASYAYSDEVTFNAQASEGFRLGGVNDPLNVPLCSPEDEAIFGGFQEYDDETLWNYEVGVKTLFDRISVNAAIFYTDIEDLQVTLDAGSCSSRVSFNVEEAYTFGGELELSAYITDALRVNFAGSLLEAEFDSTVRDGAGNIVGGVEDGNRLASVPEWQFSIEANYSFGSLWGSQDSYVNLMYQGIGDRYTQPSDQVSGAGDFQSGLPFGGATGNEVTSLNLELDSYYLTNLSAGLIYDKWDFTLFVNNLADEDAQLSFDRERGGRARLAFRVNQPRTYGATVRWRL